MRSRIDHGAADRRALYDRGITLRRNVAPGEGRMEFFIRFRQRSRSSSEPMDQEVRSLL